MKFEAVDCSVNQNPDAPHLEYSMREKNRHSKNHNCKFSANIGESENIIAVIDSIFEK
jgi:hypothetical protein